MAGSQVPPRLRESFQTPGALVKSLTRAQVREIDRLAAAIDVCEPKDLAALSRQLVAVTSEIEELAEPEHGTLADQLAARRAARLADTDASGDARPRRQSRRGRS